MGETESRAALTALKDQLRQGKIGRRDFLHALKVLGLSVGVAAPLSACGVKPTAPTVEMSGVEPQEPDLTQQAHARDFQRKFLKSTAGANDTEPASASGQSATAVPLKKQSWFCIPCGRRFASAEALQEHALEIHSKRLPEVKRVDQPTYAEFMSDQVTRFDERNVCFSRISWDKDYQAKFMQAVQNGMAKVAKLSPEQQWAAQEGAAMVAGAIYVDDTAGSLDETYNGYNGHMNKVPGLYGWEDAVNPQQYPVADPAKMAERVKQVAKFYGASLVGITKVNPLWVYSNTYDSNTGESTPVEMPYKYAIVMAVEMSWDEINTSPKHGASAATALGYSRMSEVASSLAKYVRGLGYPALPCGNDTATSIPLAIDAGLGEHGRNGLLLTPEFGPRQRLCKVFTDLPMQPDQPIDFGSGAYCDKCHACATSCPAKAIPMGDRTTELTSISNRPGIKKWTVNVSDCLLFWQENGGVDCCNCIASCPWALKSSREWL